MDPIAGTRCLQTGITIFFALTAPLELEATAATLELNAPAENCVVVAAATGCAMAFLLCFNGLAKATSAVDGHLRPTFPREGATFAASIFLFPAAVRHLLGFFPIASNFLFFTASVNSSVPGISTRHGMRPIGHNCMLKNAVQSTSIAHVRKESIVLWLSVTTNNTFQFQFNPRQKLNVIFVIILANGYEFW
jgi:hypothetical protein